MWVVRTGPATYRIKELLSNEANAYGGASRVYPVGTAWEQDVYLSPLRFVWQPADADRAKRNLIGDVRAMTSGMPAGAPKHSGALTVSLGEHAPLRELFAVISNSPASPPSPTSPPSAPSADEPKAAAPAGLAAVAAASFSPPSSPTDEQAGAAEQPAPKGKSALASTQLALETARAEIRRLGAEFEAARRSTDRAVEERVREMKVELARTQADARDRADKHAEQLAAARRKSKQGSEQTETCTGFCPELFPTAEDAVRHGIYMAWVSRITAADKAEHPLPDYIVGDGFADTLALFDAGQQAKAFRASVDVLTGLARDVAGRRLHALRAGDGGDDPQRTRPADGAVGFRVNIETNTASARRLHFWRLPDGTIELARVVLHDDMSI